MCACMRARVYAGRGGGFSRQAKLQQRSSSTRTVLFGDGIMSERALLIPSLLIKSARALLIPTLLIKSAGALLIPSSSSKHIPAPAPAPTCCKPAQPKLRPSCGGVAAEGRIRAQLHSGRACILAGDSALMQCGCVEQHSSRAVAVRPQLGGGRCTVHTRHRVCVCRRRAFSCKCACELACVHMHAHVLEHVRAQGLLVRTLT